jgi:hypothetical protein
MPLCVGLTAELIGECCGVGLFADVQARQAARGEKTKSGNKAGGKAKKGKKT